MKFIVLMLILCVLGGSQLMAGGGGQAAPRGPAANSAAIVTPPGQLPIVREAHTMTVGLRQSINVQNYETNFLTGWLREQTGITTSFQLFSSVTADSNTQFNCGLQYSI